VIIVEPDVLAPHEYFTAWRQTRFSEPERHLILAVLIDAIQTYQKFAFSRSHRGQAWFREVETWFLSTDSEDVFSFRNICDVLGLDAALFRRGLEKWRLTSKQTGSPKKVFQLRSPANRTLKPTFVARHRGFRSARGRRHGYGQRAVNPDP
jgi:hypothetical protein